MRKAFVIALMASGALLARGRVAAGWDWRARTWHGRTRMLLHGMVTGAPFSAVQVTTRQQTLANGNAIQKQETTNVFRGQPGTQCARR